MNIKKLLLVLSVVISAAIPMISSQRAEAASGACFFKSLAGPVTGDGTCTVPGRYGDYGVNDVLVGRNSSGNGMAIPNCAGSRNPPNCVSGGANAKNQFIRFIRDRFSNGNVHDRVGAAFIIQEMRSRRDQTWPSNADVQTWEDLVNLPNVNVTRGIDNAVGRTSYYDPGKHNTFYAAHPVVQREVIFVRQNGNLLAEIETACGNMVAGPGVIQPPDWTLEADSTVNGQNSIDVVAGDEIFFVHDIHNTGPDDMNEGIVGHVEWWMSTGSGIANGTVVMNCNDKDGLDDARGPAAHKICNSPKFTVPDVADGTQYCQRVIYRPKVPKRTTDSNSARACATVRVTPPPPGTTVCSILTKSKPDPVPGDNVGITFGVTGTLGSSYSIRYTIKNPAGSTSPAVTVNNTNPVLTSLNNVVRGEYTINWIFTSINGNTNNCSGVVIVSTRPYFEVMNGDANAAAGLASAACNPSGTISAFYKGGGVGSKSQIAAFAEQAITEFASAGGNGKLLAFANTDVSEPYGGNYKHSMYCIDDDWSDEPITGVQSYGPMPNVVDQKTYHVNGDIYIRDDITYNTNYASVNSLPLRKFLAENNIYILGSVKQLDGIYAAKGKIYTCAIDPGTGNLRAAGQGQPNLNEMLGCTDQLVVHGAFIAGKGIKLQRTYSTVAGLPAEQFVYSPEVWLQGIRPTNQNFSDGFDSVTNLPPVL